MYKLYAWVYSQTSFHRGPNDHENKILLDMLIFSGKKNMYNVDRKAKTMSQKMINNSTISNN